MHRFVLASLLALSTPALAYPCVIDGLTQECATPSTAEWTYSWGWPVVAPSAFYPITSEEEAEQAALAWAVAKQKGKTTCDTPAYQYASAWPDDYWAAYSPYLGQWHTTEAQFNATGAHLQFRYPGTTNPSLSQCLEQFNSDVPLHRTRSVSCSSVQQLKVDGSGQPVCVAPSTATNAQLNAGPADYGYSAICRADSDLDYAGNPVNLATGAKYQVERDYTGGGAGPLEFSRYYSSLLASSAPATQAPMNGMGGLWTHTFARGLVLPNLGQSGAVIAAVRPDGSRIQFKETGGEWSSTAKPEKLWYDANQLTWILRLRTGEEETYSGTGRLLQVWQPGYAQALTYDSASRLTAVTDSAGRSLQFVYNGDGEQIASVQLPGGGTLTYTYVGAQLVKVTYPDGRKREYQYVPNSGLLSGIVDEAGVLYASWAYSGGRAASSEHAGGVSAYVFNSGSFTDPRGVTRSLLTQIYGGETKLSEVLSVDGVRRNLSMGGLLASQSTHGEDPTYFVHDALGRETSRTYAAYTPDAVTVSTEWEPDLPLPHQITYPTWLDLYTYTADGQVLTHTATDSVLGGSRVWNYSYDSEGRLTGVDGPRTDVADQSTYAYDVQGNLESVTNALGHVTTVLSRDGAGRVAQTQDANGVLTSYAYDPRGRATSITTGGATTSFTYKSTGLLATVTPPTGGTITYSYDAAHRLIKVKDSAGNYEAYTYNNAGDLLSKNGYDSGNVLRRAQTYAYNLYGRLQQVTGAQGQTTSYTYDIYSNVDQPVSTQDALGHQTQYAYDALERVVGVTNPLQGQVDIKHDATGDVGQVTDPGNATTQYTRNGFGEVLTVASPDTGTTVFTRDAGGNIVQKTDARGVTSTYAYDALDRLTSISYPDSSLNVTLTYDQGANGIGRLTSVQDAAGTRTFTYDVRGNLTAQDLVADGVTVSVDYGYNLGDKVTSMVYPSGSQVVYTRNSRGKITAISRNGQNLLTSRLYEAGGFVKSQTWGNGRVETKTYDLDGQLATWTLGGGLLNRTYGYDTVGNVLSYENMTFTYDALDRITAEPGQSFSYDANSNRLSDVDGSYSYTAASNRMATGPPGPVTLDAAGNTLTFAGQTYTYNDAGRMATATVGGQTSSYTYYENQLRASKTVNGVATLFHYDPAGRLIAETDDAGSVLREYIWDDDVPVAQVEGATVTYLHTDQLGTPRLGTSQAGGEVWRWGSDAFGTSPPTGSVTVNLRFPGQYYDAETGLHQNWHRTYDPLSGRYVESDPIGLAGGWNTYGYVAGNTLGYTDPSGLVIETPWDVANVALSGASLVANLASGNYGGAAVDALGLTYDAVATVVPGLPGGAGATLKACRETSLKFAGGAYSKLPRVPGLERHHMPADSISSISRGKGPSIQMERADHKQTLSYGSSREAKAHRSNISSLLNQGRMRDAMAAEIRDVRRIAGPKYNGAIRGMLDYSKQAGYLNK